jgi:predicted Zn-ribbon and HTH transcriptional regulator
MYGTVHCRACGAAFDAYEFSLPNGMCERCEELADLEPAEPAEPATATAECIECGDVLEDDEVSESGLCSICEWESITDLMTCNARIRVNECGEIACVQCPVAHLR